MRAGWNRIWLVLPMALVAPGCSLAPRNFRAMLATAPIVRARAVDLEEKQPEAVAVPALIGRLGDPDPVVRMTANDHLKDRTRQDFGFVAWAEPAERQAAVGRWQAWWSERSRQAAYPRDDELRKVAVQPARKRRRRLFGGGQGGPTPWANAPRSAATRPSPPQPSTDPSVDP